MRVLLLSVIAFAAAACAPLLPDNTPVPVPPPPVAADAGPPPLAPPLATAAGRPVPLTARPPAAAPPALAPAPPVATAAPPPAGPVAAAAAPEPPGWVSPFWPRPQPRHLSLSNYSFDKARVEAVVTTSADCAVRDGGVIARSDFALPLNGTRVIEAPPGADVCWRLELAGSPAHGAPARGWSAWNRAYLSAGRSIDSRL